MLNTLLFLKEYSKFYKILVRNKFTIYCDHKEIVNKISKIKILNNYYDLNYQMSKHETIMAISITFINDMTYFTFAVIKEYNMDQ